ncbi:hypothetical protein [Candidatus Amarobacter glycogenicus]
MRNATSVAVALGVAVARPRTDARVGGTVASGITVAVGVMTA